MRRGFVLVVFLSLGACGGEGHTGDAIDGEAGDADGPFPDPPSGGGCPELALFPGLSLDPDSGLFLDPDSSSIPSLLNLQLDAPELCGFVNGEPAATKSQPCAGTIAIVFSNGLSLFDAKTGELEAVGVPYDPGQCFGVRPGFVFPTQCEDADFDAGGWFSIPPGRLCTGHDAGAEAGGIDDADASDATPDTGPLDAGGE